MSSVIVLDSSDEDEAPAKKMALPRLNSATTITVVNISKSKTPLRDSKIAGNSDDKNKNNVNNNKPNTNMLLSPALTKTFEKSKLQMIPKINTTFTINNLTPTSSTSSLTTKSLTLPTKISAISNIKQNQQKTQFHCLALPLKQNPQVQQQKMQQQKQQMDQQKQQSQPKQQLQPQQNKRTQQQQQHTQQMRQQQQQNERKVQQKQQQQQQPKQQLQPQKQQQQQQHQIQQLSTQLGKSPQQKRQTNVQQQQQPTPQHSPIPQQDNRQTVSQSQKIQDKQKFQEQQQQKMREMQQFLQRHDKHLKKPNIQQRRTQYIEMLPQPQLRMKRLQQKQRQCQQMINQNNQQDNKLQQKMKQLQEHQSQLPQGNQQQSTFQGQLETQKQHQQQKQNQPLTQIHYAQQQKCNTAAKQSMVSDALQQHMQQQQRPEQLRQCEYKRKTPTPPTPVALTVAGAHPSNIFLPKTTDGSASVVPLIQSVHSVATNSIPPLQFLSKLTPPQSTRITTNATISSTTVTTSHNSLFQCGGNTTQKTSPLTHNNIDYFKIRLPLKKPISIENTQTTTREPISTTAVITKTITTTTTTVTSTAITTTATAPTCTTTTASVLRGIKRIKPQTLLKNTDEAWLLQQKKRIRSNTSSDRSMQDDEDEIIEITSTTSSSINCSPSSTSNSQMPNKLFRSGSAQFSWLPGMQQLSPPVPVSLHLPSLSVKRITPTPPAQAAQSSPTKLLTPTSSTQSIVLESSVKSATPLPRQPTPKTIPGNNTLTSPRRITPTRASTENATMTPVFDLTNSPEKTTDYIKTTNTCSPSSSSSCTTAINSILKTTSSPRVYFINPLNGNNSTTSTAKNEMSTSAEKKASIKPDYPLIPAFQELLNVCRSVEPTEDMEKLIKKRLMRCYYSGNKNFIKSSDFRNKLRKTIDRIKTDPQLVYYNLKSVLDELKKHREVPAQGTQTKQIPSRGIPTKTKQKTKEANVATSSGSTGNNEELKQLSKTLSLITKRIEQLEQAEVDWDDDDSSYLQVERFQKRACQIYERICELLGENKGDLNPLRKKIKFEGTEIPQFNRTLQAYVNQTNEFPDYFDVLRVLEHCNNIHSLGLAQFEMKHIAEDAFIKIGKILQSQRKTDLYETITHFTANKKDPAASDPELLKKLSENQKLKKNINDIFEKYAREQEQTAEEIRLKKAATLAANSSADGMKLDKEKTNGVNVPNAIIAAAMAAENSDEESDDEESDEIDNNEDEDEDDNDDDDDDDTGDLVDKENEEDDDDDDCVEIVSDVSKKLSDNDKKTNNGNVIDNNLDDNIIGKIKVRSIKTLKDMEIGSSDSGCSTKFSVAKSTTTKKLSDVNGKTLENTNVSKLKSYNNNNNNSGGGNNSACTSSQNDFRLFQNNNNENNVITKSSSSNLKQLGNNFPTITNSKQIPKPLQIQQKRPSLTINGNICTTNHLVTLPPPPPIIAKPATDLKISSVSSLNETVLNKSNLFHNHVMTSPMILQPVQTLAEIVISDEES